MSQLGISTFARKVLVGDGRFVLMFHGVSKVRRPEIPADLQPYLEIEDLRRVLAWIRKRFVFLTPEDFLGTKKPGVLLTFDDGMANNYTNALPVLAEFEAPAIFFVSTRHVQGPRDWLPHIVDMAGRNWTDDEAVPEEIAVDLYDGMSQEQLSACARNPLLTIGSHAISHPFLTRCGAGQLLFELEESKRFLEEATGRPVALFAYPTGDYDQRVAEAVRAAGYIAAFAVDSCKVGLPAFEIPRIGIYSADPAYLSLKLSGLHRRPIKGNFGGSSCPSSLPRTPVRALPMGKKMIDTLRTPRLCGEMKVPTKIRVVFLIGELGLGGSERQLYLLLKHLNRTAFECHVIVFNPSNYVVLNDALESIGVTVHPIPLACSNTPRRIRFIYRMLRLIRPQVVHSWTVHDNPYAGVVGWLARIPVRLGSLRGSTTLQGFQSLSTGYRWLSLHSISGLLVNASSIREELLSRGYSSHRIAVLPNCVENSLDGQTMPDLAPLGIRDEHRVVASVGNLRRVKNHTMFVEAMARVLPCLPDARALVVGQPVPGDPDEPNAIQRRIRESNLDGRLILAGFRADVQALMRRLAVFCLTSTNEGMPNVVLEAMAAGVPVVATRVGGVPELVEDGVAGFLVESGDVEAFASRVLHLLSNPDAAKEMGLRGRERVKRDFSCDCAAQALARLYRAELDRKQAPADR